MLPLFLNCSNTTIIRTLQSLIPAQPPIFTFAAQLVVAVLTVPGAVTPDRTGHTKRRLADTLEPVRGLARAVVERAQAATVITVWPAQPEDTEQWPDRPETAVHISGQSLTSRHCISGRSNNKWVKIKWDCHIFNITTTTTSGNRNSSNNSYTLHNFCTCNGRNGFALSLIGDRGWIFCTHKGTFQLTKFEICVIKTTRCGGENSETETHNSHTSGLSF